MRVHSFALAMLAVLPVLAQAQSADSPVVASANMSLNNLTIQLIDLNPNDGVAPGIQFHSVGTLNYSQVSYDYATNEFTYTGPTFSNALTPSQNLTTTVGNTTSVATPNSLAISTFTTAADLTAAEIAYPMSSTVTASVNNGTALMLFSPDPASSDVSFTLTANTAVVVTGTLKGGVMLDGRPVQSLSPSDQYSYWSLSGTPTQHSTSASILLQTYDQVLSDESAFAGQLVSGGALSVSLDDYTGNSVNTYTDPANLVIQHSLSKDFTLQYANTSAQSITGDLSLSLSVSADVQLARELVSPPVDPGTIDPGTPPAIPEPGTLALMGLGLAGLALVSRRQTRI